MIERLIAALLSSNNNLDWRDLADVLWLVQTTTAGVSRQHVVDTKSVETATWLAQPDASDPLSVPSNAFPVVNTAEPAAADQDVMIRRGITGDPASEGYSVKPVGRFALPGQLEIARALRPLKHRRRSLHDSSFDVDATVDHYCHTGLLVPIMKPSKERWFRDLALVSDGGPTMVVWDETIAAWATLLEREGGFDRVSRWTMTGDSRQISLSSPNGLPHRPEQLIDDGGRRLIVVVTDCVGSPWRGAPAWAALRSWGRFCPVVLVQMLPPRLWPATALGSADLLLSSHRRGAPNRLLRLRSPWWWDADEPPHDGIPVVALDEVQLGAWARMLMGAAGIEVPGVIAGAPHREAPVELGTAQVPAATRVSTFRSTVSSEASQLATLLSAVDVTLPVAQLILNALIPNARQTYLAEVFASGLLEPSVAVANQSYDFAPGVRELLQESLTATSVFDVWRTVGPYIESAKPGSPSFSIILDRNAEIPTDQGSAMSNIALQVAERLGLRKPHVSSSSADDRTRTVENVPAPGRPRRSSVSEYEIGRQRGAGYPIQLDRVVAVVLSLANGGEQVGTGYLVGGRQVLTAAHCTRDRVTGATPQPIRVIRATGGQVVVSPDAVTVSEILDLAVIRLPQDAPWDIAPGTTSYARIHRDRAGVVECTTIGYPLYQYDPGKHTRHHGELHGTINQTDEAESGRLLMRVQLTYGLTRTDDLAPTGNTGGWSGWAGLSGALVFHADHAIGVVLEHHSRQGADALQLCGFDQLISTATTDDATRRVAALLGLSQATELPFATDSAVLPLYELVGISRDGDLPTVADLDPYRLGASKSAFGDSQTYGQHDPYVPRTFNDVDNKLAAALHGPRMVLVIGPSKAGKTRTSYEALRSGFPDARVLTPLPGTFEQLVAHPRLRTSTDTVVVWLDDLERYLTSADPLTRNLCVRLTDRPGTTIMVATLRTEARDRLATETGGLAFDTRWLLNDAETIHLLPTSEDPEEQATAARFYPGQDLRFGLAAVLAGAPGLLRRYDAAKHDDPLQHAVIAVVIDWVRVGRPDPIPEPVLKKLAIDRLWDTRPDLEITDQAAEKAIRAARTPPESAGRVAALTTFGLPNRFRGYRPLDYLVAADDGENHALRPVPDAFWDQALEDADPEIALLIGGVARDRKNTSAAISAYQIAATAGNTDAMVQLGTLLGTQLDPPDVAAAHTWLEQAAHAGNTDAMVQLGTLLATQLDPPDVAAAHTWLERAAVDGNLRAQTNLGMMLQQRGQLDEAETWYRRAAEAGNAVAQTNLGMVLQQRGQLDEAETWYYRAAEAGDTVAQTKLGEMLQQRGELGEAEAWYRRAAEAGDTVAQTNLGMTLQQRGAVGEAEA